MNPPAAPINTAAQIADVLLLAAVKHRARMVHIGPISGNSYSVVFYRQGQAVASAYLPGRLGQVVVERYRFLAELDPVGESAQSASFRLVAGPDQVQLFLRTQGRGATIGAELWVLYGSDEADAAVAPFENVTRLRPGDMIGPLRILRQLGAGGMGLVYRAHHVLLDRPCAVKILRRECLDDPTALDRFFREARLGAQTEHEGTVSIMDVGTLPDGRPYIVMELIEGCSLEQIVTEEGPVEPLRAIALARDTARSLGELHDRGVVHCDVTPANIFVSGEPPAERVKICDFGSARVHEEQEEESEIVFGTPLYMAPEQIRGYRCDGRTDLYALGVVLFEMIAGKVPFDGDSAVAIARRHLTDMPPLLTGPHGALPLGLAGVVARLLQKDPKDRYQTAQGLVADLERILGGSRRTTVRMWTGAMR